MVANDSEVSFIGTDNNFGWFFAPRIISQESVKRALRASQEPSAGLLFWKKVAICLRNRRDRAVIRAVLILRMEGIVRSISRRSTVIMRRDTSQEAAL